tara:strand:+ start:391 stop:651 length:261 start_codon:yes stop_codon:yes gene_type:complete
MIIEIILGLVVIFLSVVVFYALKRINQYEELLIEFQQIVQFSSDKLKQVDSKGTFESDDEVGFFFQEIQKIQKLLNDIFENETEKK